MKLSLIIPIYNEEKNISRLHHSITQTMTENDYNYELIMIDDGSSDRSIEMIEALSKQDRISNMFHSHVTLVKNLLC